MITLEQQQKGQELMRTLVEKALENANFKEQLIKTPELAIQEITGKSFTLPENKRLIVEDQTDESIIYLNIPAVYNLDEFELSDEQLNHVAGGEIGLAAGIVVGLALCYVVDKYM